MRYTANSILEEDKYLKGKENFLIRIYFYLSRGLEIPNNFRNLILGIGAVYITLKLESVWIAVIMFVVSAFVLTLFGWYNVHRLSKVQEALSMRFSTHYSIKAYTFQEEQTKLLLEIRDLMKSQFVDPKLLNDLLAASMEKK